MMPDSSDTTRQDNILTRIQNGMTVYDCDGTKLGTVRDVYLGDVTATKEKRGLGPATASPPEEAESSLLEDFRKAVAPPDPLPKTLRQRLWRHGFIRIDSSGLFASDRYAMPQQIAQVSADRVTLEVRREVLIKG